MFRFHTARVWTWERGRRPVAVKTECALLLYTEGRAYVDFERKRKRLNNKLLLYVQPESTVAISPADGQPTAVIGIFFHAYALEEQSDAKLVYRSDYSMLPNNGYVVSPVTQRTPALVQELVQQSGHTPPDDYICGRTMNELAHQITLQMNSSGMSRTTAEQAVTETIQHMLEACERNWTREEAARSAKFNASHFSRAFRLTSGYSFSALLGKIRLNRARILLLSTSLTLDRIAHRTGFMNGLYLSRRMKQDCGMSPTAYRDRLRQRPLRIATMQQAGDLLALGIVPIAASLAPWNTSPLLHSRLLEAGTTGVYELEDAEQLRALKPDLILIPDYVLTQNASRLRQLEHIAPVLFFTCFRDDTLARLRLLADIVGRQEEAQRWTARYESRALPWKRRLAAVIAPGETAALYEIRGDNHVVIWLKGCRSAYNIYETLQLQPPTPIRLSMDGRRSSFIIPVGQLPHYAADHMFVISEHDHPQQLYAALSVRHIWPTLPAFRRHRLYSLPLHLFWADDAAALELQLPLIVEAAEQPRKPPYAT